MPEQLATLAQSTLIAGIGSSTSSLQIADATRFPTSGTFRVRLDTNPVSTTFEIVTVTAVSGATLSGLTRGTEGTTAQAWGIGTTATLVLTAAALKQFVVDSIAAASLGLYDLFAYGAKGDNVTDDTASAQAAIDAAFAAGGGIVWAHAAQFKVSQLVLKDGVSIWGSGEGSINFNTHSGHTPGTVFRAPLGSSVTTGMIVDATGLGTVSSPELRGFTLDGNNGSNFAAPAQTPNGFDGINFSGAVSRLKMDAVTIINVPRDGLNFPAGVSLGDSGINRVTIINPYRHGVNHQGSDVHYNGVEVINPGQNSYVLAGTEATLTNCKSNTSGQLGLGLGTQEGFYISGAAHIIAGCNSENDYVGNGFYVHGAARCKIHATASGSGNALLYLDNGANGNDIDIEGNNQQNHTNPAYFYQIDGATTLHNRVRTKGDPTLLTSYANLTNGGGETGNDFYCENEGATGRQAVSYAATITPDPYLGGHISIGTLTGALTLNAPSRGHAGTRVTFRLRQDAAGGHVVTWDPVYVTTRTVSTTPLTTTHVTFVFDGTNWNQLSWDGPSTTSNAAPNYAIEAGAQNSYDAHRNLYNVRPSGIITYRSTRAAAIQGSALCRVAFAAGDSTYSGVTASTGLGVRGTADVSTNLRKLLAGVGMPTGGTGIVPAPGQQNDPRWTIGTGWSSTVPYAKGITPGGTLTFTPNAGETGTIANVWYWNNSKPFTVTIDGGAPVTVTPPLGSTLGLYQVTGLANTTHTIVYTAGGAATSGTPCYCVAMEVTPAAGITISNLGVSGSGTAPWISTVFPQYSYPGLNIGRESPTPFGSPFCLVFIGLLLNDWNTSVSVATHKANIQSIITNWKSVSNPPSIALTVPAQGDNLLGDNTATLPWGSYVQNMYQLADANGLPLVDFDDRWQDNWTLANSLGYMTTANPFHPSATGYQDQAFAVAGLVGDI